MLRNSYASRPVWPSICGHQMVLCNQLRAPQHPQAPTHPKTASFAMHRLPHHQQLKDPALGQPTRQSHSGDSPVVAKHCSDSHAVSGTSSHHLL